MGKVIDRIKKGVDVFCEEQKIGEVSKTFKCPDWGKTEFFTVNIKEREILLPIDIIYKAEEHGLYLNNTLEEINKLPDIKGKDICNEAGYIFPDLKAYIYQILDLARPYLDYY